MSNFVTIQNQEANEMRTKNLLHIAKGIGFLWLTFHFLIIFFFGLVLESVLLVWLFLWFWNFVALLFDIPAGVLQKYIKPKTFLVIATVCMLFASAIFVKFVYFEWIAEIFTSSWWDVIDKTVSFVALFLESWLNLVLLFVAAALYGIIKESYDVTTLSYIFNISTPSEYATLISKYSINFGIWAMLWLVLSGVILSFGIQIAIVCLVIFVLIFLAIIVKFFDNSVETITFDDIKKLRIDTVKSDLLQKKDQMIQNISLETLKTVAKTSKVIFLKPIQLKREIDFKDVVVTSKQNFEVFLKIIFSKPFNLIILWLLWLIMVYGFWDTFVSTFQIDFLDKIIWLNQDNLIIEQSRWLLSGYVFLWLLVIPAFLFQDFFIKISQKIWVFKVIMLWSLLSSGSLFMFGFVDAFYFVLLFWLINSVWYAAVMPIAQATFSEKYNVEYAKKFNLKEIDSTVSAAPLKVILNSANVVWLLLGWMIVWVLGFNGFFIVFSCVLFWIFLYSLIHMKIFSKVDEEPIPEVPKIDEDFE